MAGATTYRALITRPSQKFVCGRGRMRALQPAHGAGFHRDFVAFAMPYLSFIFQRAKDTARPRVVAR